MDGACSTYGEEERYVQGFGGNKWGKETTWNTQSETKNNTKIDV